MEHTQKTNKQSGQVLPSDLSGALCGGLGIVKDGVLGKKFSHTDVLAFDFGQWEGKIHLGVWIESIWCPRKIHIIERRFLIPMVKSTLP